MGGGVFARSEMSFPSLYNCWGQVDHIHVSVDHNPGHVTAEARTRCNTAVHSVFVASELVRTRWYGLEFLDEDFDDKIWQDRHTTAKANPAWYCVGTGTYTYGVFNEHSALTNGGNLMTGSTVATRTLDC